MSGEGSPQRGPTYWEYLRLHDLLDLQDGIEASESDLAPDELHFIIVHQVFELWFKLVIHELRLASKHLSAHHVDEDRIPYVVHHLRRVNLIFGHAIQQFDVVETLDALDFIDFRDKLVPASGFQSFQYRMLEILLGKEDDGDRVYADKILAEIKRLTETSASGPKVWELIERARSGTTLRRALHEWLYRTPIDGSTPDSDGDSDRVDRFADEFLAAYEAYQRKVLSNFPVGQGGDTTDATLEDSMNNAEVFLLATDKPEAERAQVKRVRAGILFIESYRELPLLAWPRLLLDAVAEVEERLNLWRTRHARLVERIIGNRIGTGGSSGAAFLHGRTREFIFPELWHVRTILLPRAMTPKLERRAFYGFASDE